MGGIAYQTDVGQLRNAFHPQNVGGLDVAVNQAGGVERLDSGQQRTDQFQRFIRVQTPVPLQPFSQRIGAISRFGK